MAGSEDEEKLSGERCECVRDKCEAGESLHSD